MIRHPCWCVTATDQATGAIVAIEKCRTHRRDAKDPASLDLAYYASLGVVEAGRIASERYLAEIREAIGEFPPALETAIALEIGCGISPYAGAIQERGWSYLGLDASPFAAGYTAGAWGVDCLATTWERFEPPVGVGLVLAAHSIEHLADAPKAIAKMAAALAPEGQLWIVVPDDTDLCNPEHFWFFNESNLRGTVEAVGLRVQSVVTRQIVRHENFLFLRAIKPASS